MPKCLYAGCAREFLPAYPGQDYCCTDCRRDDKKPGGKQRQRQQASDPARTAGRANFKSGDVICRAPWCSKRVKHEHHVVHLQELEKLQLPLWDKRDALGTCVNCHFNHHSGARKLPLSCLHDCNIEFAFEVLGARAGDYLRRKYAGEDARVAAKELACRPQ